jgi:hypothetical protein
MRRLLVLAVVVTIGLSIEAAHAGFDVTVEFAHKSASDPETVQRSATPRPGTALTGLWKVVADARSASSSLRRFSVSILPSPSESGIPTPSNASINRDYSGIRSSDQIAFDWDTTRLTPYNGTYRLVGIADSVGDRHEVTVSDLKVNNPPLAPTGLAVKLVNDVPQLSWNKSPELDLTRYSILRSDDGGDLKEVGSATKAAFQDTKAPKGIQLRYRIVAVRKSPLSTSGISSLPSEPSAALVISTGVSITVPTTAAAPAPAPLRAPVREGTHQGFSETLPIEGLPPAAAGVAEAEEEASPDNAVESFLGAPARILQSTVKKLPFIAGAMLMLVTAMHVMRLALRMMRSLPDGTPILE